MFLSFFRGITYQSGEEERGEKHCEISGTIYFSPLVLWSCCVYLITNQRKSVYTCKHKYSFLIITNSSLHDCILEKVITICNVVVYLLLKMPPKQVASFTEFHDVNLLGRKFAHSSLTVIAFQSCSLD